MMRTTLDIDGDVLQAARELARAKRISLGKALSDLARQALTSRISDSDEAFYGFAPLKPRGGVVTNELIDRLREEED